MDLNDCYNREMEILDEQLQHGQIDIYEYDRAVQELEQDLMDESMR